MISYPIGRSGHTISFSEGVIAHFALHQQKRWWNAESGGQLFARIERGLILVVEATGPRHSDRRSRFRYSPDRQAEQREIEERFPQGLHFIGDWHTHPEDCPSPSPLDLTTTADGVSKSLHSLNAFVLAIVGRSNFPNGLNVSLHDGYGHYVLEPATSKPEFLNLPACARPCA